MSEQIQLIADASGFWLIDEDGEFCELFNTREEANDRLLDLAKSEAEIAVEATDWTESIEISRYALRHQGELVRSFCDLEYACDKARELVRAAGKGCATVWDLKTDERVYVAQHKNTF